MRTFILILGLFALPLPMVADLSMAIEPEVVLPGPGGQTCGYDWLPLWLDNPDFLATIASSEVISAHGLVTEIANDFITEKATTVKRLSWWGAYWNGFEGTPSGSGFNLRFYFDAGAVPESDPFAEYLLPGDTCAESLAEDCDEGSDFQFLYVLCLDLQLEPSHYWFSVQMADHGFTPQWGRLGGDMTQLYPSCFRSEYFGHPEWVPLTNVIGITYDASQMLEDVCLVPVKTASWGAIKGLYR